MRLHYSYLFIMRYASKRGVNAWAREELIKHLRKNKNLPSVNATVIKTTLEGTLAEREWIEIVGQQYRLGPQGAAALEDLEKWAAENPGKIPGAITSVKPGQPAAPDTATSTAPTSKEIVRLRPKIVQYFTLADTAFRGKPQRDFDDPAYTELKASPPEGCEVFRTQDNLLAIDCERTGDTLLSAVYNLMIEIRDRYGLVIADIVPEDPDDLPKDENGKPILTGHHVIWDLLWATRNLSAEGTRISNVHGLLDLCLLGD